MSKLTRDDFNPTLEQRFWTYLTAGAPDECWEWMGSRLPGRHNSVDGYCPGYGRISNNRNGKSQGEYAHRVAYVLMVGDIPEGKHVLHRCDHPPCCNPAHLFLGTPQINAIDREQKGRRPTGPGPRVNAIPIDQRWEIASDYTQGTPIKTIAERLGVSPVFVNRTLRRMGVRMIQSRRRAARRPEIR